VSITSSAVLAELNISVWPAKKLDRTTSATITSNANALGDAAQVKKNLFAGTTLRKDIENYAARIRLYHNQHTLPWSDKGQRLLTTKLFLEYKQYMNTAEAMFNQLCDTFFQAYPKLVIDAQKSLGSLYDPDDYPALEEVKDKFAFKLSIDPLPESGDFRLDASADELNDIKADYERRYEERLSEAMRSAWDRLHKELTHISQKLADCVGGDDAPKKRYHETMITNAQGLCGLLTKLNVTNDPKLEEARRSLEVAIFNTDIETIKDSAQARSEVKSKVDDILKKFEW
jgi:hypothetical protein